MGSFCKNVLLIVEFLKPAIEDKRVPRYVVMIFQMSCGLLLSLLGMFLNRWKSLFDYDAEKPELVLLDVSSNSVMEVKINW